MAPVIEVAFFPLKAGTNFEDSSDASQIVKEASETLRQQDGYRGSYIGLRVEDQSVAEMLIDWDSIDAHTNFTQTPEFGPFAKSLVSLLAAQYRLQHVYIDPTSATAARSAPATEMVTCYFPASVSEDEQKNYMEGVTKLGRLLEEKAEGCRGVCAGWVREELENEKIEGKKSKAMLMMLGWDSVEAHMKFRETQLFADNIHYLREGPAAMEVHHVKLAQL